MSKIHSADIRAELRPAAQLLRFTAPAPSKSGFERYDRQCRKKYDGKWTSRDTYAEEKAIIREDGSVLRLLVVRSVDGSMDDATGLLWLHDGGYAFGVPEQDSLIVDEFCGDGSCVAVMPDYTKSLEKPYPAALEDCYKALLWMCDNAQELGINREQLFVGGCGAGGGLTAAVCLRARDVGDVHVAFQMPLYPMLDDRMENESSADNNAPVWDSRRNRVAWDLYLRDMEEEIPVYAAPGREENFAGMPPACSFVGDLEPLKDETVLYFARMKKAGIPVALRVYHGCYHAFDLTAVNSEVARNARRYMMESFRYAQQHYFAHNKEGDGTLFEQAGKIESMPQVMKRTDEKLTGEKLNGGKLTNEGLTGEKLNSEKDTGGKLTGEKLTGEKAEQSASGNSTEEQKSLAGQEQLSEDKHPQEGHPETAAEEQGETGDAGNPEKQQKKSPGSAPGQEAGADRPAGGSGEADDRSADTLN